MKIFEFFLIIRRKWSELEPERNFRQAGAGAAQKWTGSATLGNSISGLLCGSGKKASWYLNFIPCRIYEGILSKNTII
jgi:hypothetical protein